MCLLAFFLLSGVGTATSGAGAGGGSKNAGRTKILPVAGPWPWCCGRDEKRMRRTERDDDGGSERGYSRRRGGIGVVPFMALPALANVNSISSPLFANSPT